MLNNRQISEHFEVQVNTLYNWQKHKPKLYKYLQNADYNQERNDEINILLSEYSTSIQKEFLIGEIEYLIQSPIKLVSMDEVKNFQKIFIEKEYSHIPTSSDKILSIYDKISGLNIIEKYILYKKVHKIRENNNRTDEDIKLFFQEFISNS